MGDLRKYRFVLKSPRCPCYCGGEGLIIILRCPDCGRLAGACDEVDTLIPDINKPGIADTEGGNRDAPCPSCGKEHLKKFEWATIEEIENFGLKRTDVQRWPDPYPDVKVDMQKTA